ncbi:MAG TPA: hypothetical protein VGT79_02745 [Xanthomonadaceae bacterium]|nr:hypothetical protein [Xanthomonadaceae bacterium]
MLALWRQHTGRLFIFRDAPCWFVDCIADGSSPADVGQHRPDINDFYEQACNEQRLRKRVQA